MIMTKEKFDWLKQNYKIFGVKKCSKYLGIATQTVKQYASKFGLKYKLPDKLNSDIKNLIKIPEFCYFLGLCYADGTIRNTTNRINITILEDDAINITPNLLKTIPFKIWKVIRKNRKPKLNFSLASKKLWNFLYNNNYFEKSTRSADKILSKIPKHLKHYFFRGFLDGDGHIDSTSNRINKVVFAGSYNQDWTFLKKLMEKLKIKFHIKRNINKTGKNSVLIIIGMEKCLPLLQYIYNNRNIDKIGFNRKYKKFQNCVFFQKKKLNKLLKTIKTKNNKYIVYICNPQIKKNKRFTNYWKALKFKKKMIKKLNNHPYRLTKILSLIKI